MDSSLFYWAIALGLLNHIYFNKFEPRSASLPIILFLALEPIALLLLLGRPISSSRLQVLLSYAAFYASLTLSIVLYRLSPFHPLAQYPGPIVARISKLWGVAIAVQGKQYLYLKELHDRYGMYVRTGPNELSISDATAVSQILNAGGLVKGRFYESGRHPSTPPTIISLIGEPHATKRRVWNRAMASPRDYDPLITKRAVQLVQRMGEQQPGEKVDLTHWFELFALDFMGDLAFGGVFEMLREGKDVGAVGDRIRSFMAAATVLGHVPWILGLLSLVPQVGRTMREFNEFGQGLAMRRMESGALLTKDLWYYIADEGGLEKEKPTLESAAADGIVGIIAASDTTAHILTSLIWCLLSNPECYQRVQQELDSVFVKGDEVAEYSVEREQLGFLSACINETLRLFPSVPINLGTRQVHPGSGGGRMIAGRYVTEGTSVYTPTYVLHRNPEYFSRPDEFLPDRWLAATELGSGFKHDVSAFMPFSQGPANCAGQQLARRQIQAVVAGLLNTYEVRFAEGFDGGAWPGGICDFSTATRGPLLVGLTRRV